MIMSKEEILLKALEQTSHVFNQKEFDTILNAMEEYANQPKENKRVMKTCPRCNKLFTTEGTYCGEKCLNEDLPF